MVVCGCLCEWNSHIDVIARPSPHSSRCDHISTPHLAVQFIARGPPFTLESSSCWKWHLLFPEETGKAARSLVNTSWDDTNQRCGSACVINHPSFQHFSSRSGDSRSTNRHHGEGLFETATLHGITLDELESWRCIYTPHDVRTCMSKVTGLSYGQSVLLFGAGSATPSSSGFAIGACNWTLETMSHKLVYLAASSVATKRHPLPLDRVALQGSDVCIVSGIARPPYMNPDSMVGELLSRIGESPCLLTTVRGWLSGIPHAVAYPLFFPALTIRIGGSVLLPSYSSGIVYDLIDATIQHLMSLNLVNVPIFMISKTAEHSLAYANIFSEW